LSDPCRQESASRRALALVSGGLDSALAVRVLLDQGVSVTALHFVSVFSPGRDPAGRLAAREVTRALGVPLIVKDATRAMLGFVPEPRYGWGRHVNPCIDCRVHHLREAKAMLKNLGAQYVATGEVLGQRPMSQHREALTRVERESGLEGLVLRPLSALNLDPTVPEREGWVDRARLLGISGRGRSEQNDLARRWGLTGYTAPAGGCLLTDPNFAWKMQDLLNWEGALTPRDAHLMKLGRHFRLACLRACDSAHRQADSRLPARVVVGRNERENAKLVTFRRAGDWLLVAAGGRSPETLLVGSGDAAPDSMRNSLSTAARLTARYCGGRDLPEVEIVARPAVEGEPVPSEEGEVRLTVAPAGDEEVARLQVRREG